MKVEPLHSPVSIKTENDGTANSVNLEHTRVSGKTWDIGMRTRQDECLVLKVDVGGETVRVFGRPEELAERLEASGYDIPASEIEAGMELHLPCLVKVGQGTNGYMNIEELLPDAAG